MTETIGIPLELIIEQLYGNDMVIDWLDFFLTGIETGWTKERIFFKIESGLVDNDMDSELILTKIEQYVKMLL